MTADSDVFMRPAPQPAVAVPAHLVGTRAAIFHLLRARATVQETPPSPVPAPAPAPAPVAPVAPVTAPRARTQVPTTPAAPTRLTYATAIEQFLRADQFEFRSPDPQDAAARSRTASHEAPAPGRAMSA